MFLAIKLNPSYVLLIVPRNQDFSHILFPRARVYWKEFPPPLLAFFMVQKHLRWITTSTYPYTSGIACSIGNIDLHSFSPHTTDFFRRTFSHFHFLRGFLGRNLKNNSMAAGYLSPPSPRPPPLPRVPLCAREPVCRLTLTPFCNTFRSFWLSRIWECRLVFFVVSS